MDDFLKRKELEQLNWELQKSRDKLAKELAYYIDRTGHWDDKMTKIINGEYYGPNFSHYPNRKEAIRSWIEWSKK
jgi:hypothetical protein